MAEDAQWQQAAHAASVLLYRLARSMLRSEADAQDAVQTTLMRKSPSGAFQCTGCGKCTRHCPQHIDIPAQLTEARKVLETPLYRIARRALQIFKLW